MRRGKIASSREKIRGKHSKWVKNYAGNSSGSRKTLQTRFRSAAAPPSAPFFIIDNFSFSKLLRLMRVRRCIMRCKRGAFGLLTSPEGRLLLTFQFSCSCLNLKWKFFSCREILVQDRMSDVVSPSNQEIFYSVRGECLDLEQSRAGRTLHVQIWVSECGKFMIFHNP